jgi:hypothetical protein
LNSLLESLDILGMEIQEIVILLVLAVISSLATRMVVGGIYEQMSQARGEGEGFSNEQTKIPIQNILKHLQMNSAIVPKNDMNYLEAADQPQEAIHLKGLTGGVSFKTLKIENIGGYRPGILLCDSADCHIAGESWGIYMPPKNITQETIDFVHHRNGYIATDYSSRKQIQREFNQPSMVLTKPNIIKPHPPVFDSAPVQELPVAPVSVPVVSYARQEPTQPNKCPVAGEVKIWNGLCMSKTRMETEFKYWTSSQRVSEFKRKGQYYSNIVPNLNKLNVSYKLLTGKDYPIPK